MNRSSIDNPSRRRHRREKATIDHLVDRVFEPEHREQHQQPGMTENGASVEEQVRKEWDPRKGGLPIFRPTNNRGRGRMQRRDMRD